MYMYLHFKPQKRYEHTSILNYWSFSKREWSVFISHAFSIVRNRCCVRFINVFTYLFPGTKWDLFGAKASDISNSIHIKSPEMPKTSCADIKSSCQVHTIFNKRPILRPPLVLLWVVLKTTYGQFQRYALYKIQWLQKLKEHI